MERHGPDHPQRAARARLTAFGPTRPNAASVATVSRCANVGGRTAAGLSAFGSGQQRKIRHAFHSCRHRIPFRLRGCGPGTADPSRRRPLRRPQPGPRRVLLLQCRKFASRPGGKPYPRPERRAPAAGGGECGARSGPAAPAKLPPRPPTINPTPAGRSSARARTNCVACSSCATASNARWPTSSCDDPRVRGARSPADWAAIRPRPAGGPCPLCGRSGAPRRGRGAGRRRTRSAPHRTAPGTACRGRGRSGSGRPCARAPRPRR